MLAQSANIGVEPASTLVTSSSPPTEPRRNSKRFPGNKKCGCGRTISGNKIACLDCSGNNKGLYTSNLVSYV